LDHYALRVAQRLSRLLVDDGLREEVEELSRFIDQISPQRRIDLVVNLREAASRFDAVAARFDLDDVEAVAGERAPVQAALTG